MTEEVLAGQATALQIKLFGAFEVRLHERPLPTLRSRKGQWLLALLTLRQGREVPRSWLAGTLWPESGSRRPYTICGAVCPICGGHWAAKGLA